MRTSGGSDPVGRHGSRKTEDFSIFRIFGGLAWHYKSLRELLGEKLDLDGRAGFSV
jgi:hypothetical protein